jgi:hypothetical protein
VDAREVLRGVPSAAGAAPSQEERETAQLARKKYRWAPRVFDDEGIQMCCDCERFLSSDAFTYEANAANRKRHACKECVKFRNRAWRDGHRGFIQIRISGATTRTAQKNVDRALAGRPALPPCNLTIEHLDELWRGAGGECHYSGVAMSRAANSAWVASLERLDQGYARGNVVWTCGECNTRRQWSRDFAESVWGPAGATASAAPPLSPGRPPWPALAGEGEAQ